MKITSQNAGSVFSGISDTVAAAIISPNSDNVNKSFQFMIIGVYGINVDNKYLYSQMTING